MYWILKKDSMFYKESENEECLLNKKSWNKYATQMINCFLNKFPEKVLQMK